jgi:hypothetical protein
MPHTTVRHSAAALLCHFADNLALRILSSALDRIKLGKILRSEKATLAGCDSLKIPKPIRNANGTFEVVSEKDLRASTQMVGVVMPYVAT